MQRLRRRITRVEGPQGQQNVEENEQPENRPGTGGDAEQVATEATPFSDAKTR